MINNIVNELQINNITNNKINNTNQMTTIKIIRDSQMNNNITGITLQTATSINMMNITKTTQTKLTATINIKMKTTSNQTGSQTDKAEKIETIIIIRTTRNTVKVQIKTSQN